MTRRSPTPLLTGSKMKLRLCAEPRSGRLRGLPRPSNSRAMPRMDCGRSRIQWLSRSGASRSPLAPAASVRRGGLGLLEPLDLVLELKFLALEFVDLDVV